MATPAHRDELENLVEARIREEVLYREALAVGLDTNDMVVRRRMVQKMEMLSQDLALLADPTDAELAFDENKEDYRIPPESTSPTSTSTSHAAATTPKPTPWYPSQLRAHSLHRLRASERRPLQCRSRFQPPIIAAGGGASSASNSPKHSLNSNRVDRARSFSGYGLKREFDGRIPIWTEVRDGSSWTSTGCAAIVPRMLSTEGLSEKYTIVINNGDAG